MLAGGLLRTKAAARPRLDQALRLLIWLLAIAFAIRLPFFFIQGYWYDVLLFRRWAAAAYEQGLTSILSDPEIDYIAYAYVLWVIAAVVDPFVHGPLAESKALLQAVKVPGLLGDLAVTALLFWGVRRWLGRNPGLLGEDARSLLARLPIPGFEGLSGADRAALAVAALYAFNVGVLYDSGYWGQTDSLVTFFMVAAVFALLERRPVASCLLLAAGLLIKPQAVVVAPLLGLAVLRNHGFKATAQGAAAAAAMYMGAILYFIIKAGWDPVHRVYSAILDPESRVSVSAWNLWQPLQYYEHARPSDVLLRAGGVAVSYETVSNLLIGLAVALLAAYVLRSRDGHKLFIGASFLVFAFFMLPMKMHERYLFPVLALLAPAAVLERPWLALYGVLTVTFTLNVSAIFPINKEDQYFMHHEFSMAVTAINLASFLAMGAYLLRQALRRDPPLRAAEPLSLPLRSSPDT
ncbi:MAG TPA: glycosyltransferase 87 family protein [Dehalococcoidia bacterium]|nr:glycosyltransferase 87 family protein [Dehalococcoidia bacterium]